MRRFCFSPYGEETGTPQVQPEGRYKRLLPLSPPKGSKTWRLDKKSKWAEASSFLLVWADQDMVILLVRHNAVLLEEEGAGMVAALLVMPEVEVVAAG